MTKQKNTIKHFIYKLSTFESIFFSMLYIVSILIYKNNKILITIEPRHDKTNKIHVRTANTQISLGISPVWSESSLSAWRSIGSLATQRVHSEDSHQTGRMHPPGLIWVFVGRTGHFVGFVIRRLIIINQVQKIMMLIKTKNQLKRSLILCSNNAPLQITLKSDVSVNVDPRNLSQYPPLSFHHLISTP